MSGEAATVWLAALTLLACVLFAGKPDIVDGLRERIIPHAHVCPQPEVEKK